MPFAGIALGSNLGNRIANIRNARDLLRAVAVPNSPVLQAPIFQTEPVNCPEGSPDFYNTVIEIEFAGSAFHLLDHAQAIEFKLGRAAGGERNAPRTIDVDLLYFGDLRIDAGLLVLPHPRLLERQFVLRPLAEIRPDLILPGDHATIAEHLAHLESDESPPMLLRSAW
jgi:2-amino-4-hydroxy-6-hydroxymethyldihydropteridine diphosphokinase